MHPRLQPDWIIRFFGTDDTEDSEGRTFNDIIRFNNIDLEVGPHCSSRPHNTPLTKAQYNHDYIQLLFPLPEASPFNPGAPLITSTVRTAFLNGPGLRERMVIALERMLQFYGLGINPSYSRAELASLKTVPTPSSDEGGDTPSGVKYHGPLMGEGMNFTRRASATWLKNGDHNHLRLTRIIRSLRVLGLEVLALALYEQLTVGSKRDKVGRRSKMFWKRAATRELWLPPSEDDKDADGVTWLRGEILSDRERDAGVKAELSHDGDGVKKEESSIDGTKEEASTADPVKTEIKSDGPIKKEVED